MKEVIHNTRWNTNPYVYHVPIDDSRYLMLCYQMLHISLANQERCDAMKTIKLRMLLGFLIY